MNLEKCAFGDTRNDSHDFISRIIHHLPAELDKKLGLLLASLIQVKVLKAMNATICANAPNYKLKVTSTRMKTLSALGLFTKHTLTAILQSFLIGTFQGRPHSRCKSLPTQQTSFCILSCVILNFSKCRRPG